MSPRPPGGAAEVFMSVKEHLKALSIGKGADAGGGERPTALKPVSDLSPANLNFRFSPLSGFEWKESGRGRERECP